MYKVKTKEKKALNTKSIIFRNLQLFRSNLLCRFRRLLAAFIASSVFTLDEVVFNYIMSGVAMPMHRFVRRPFANCCCV